MKEISLKPIFRLPFLSFLSRKPQIISYTCPDTRGWVSFRKQKCFCVARNPKIEFQKVSTFFHMIRTKARDGATFSPSQLNLRRMFSKKTIFVFVYRTCGNVVCPRKSYVANLYQISNQFRKNSHQSASAPFLRFVLCSAVKILWFCRSGKQ
jgi:hypothetical protein